jgi:hypothetical protein
MTNRSTATDVPCGSLYEEAHQEADRFKWLESERSRYDLGPAARQEWARRYWPVFIRWKRLEHLSGQRRYVEFEQETFGSLTPDCLGGADVDFVFDRFVNDRWENLHYFWDRERTGCTRDELMNVLELMGINHLRRLTPPDWYGDAI